MVMHAPHIKFQVDGSGLVRNSMATWDDQFLAVEVEHLRVASDGHLRLTVYFDEALARGEIPTTTMHPEVLALVVKTLDDWFEHCPHTSVPNNLVKHYIKARAAFQGAWMEHQ